MTLPILILPCWKYHPTQGGKIFRTREDIDQAEASGWRDSPAAAAAVEAEPLPVIETPADTSPDDGVVVAITKKRKR